MRLAVLRLTERAQSSQSRTQGAAQPLHHLPYGLARARAKLLFDRPYDLAQCHRDVEPGLAAEHPTIADLACYPYVSLAGEGDFSLQLYPSVREWLRRLRQLDGWVPMLE